MSYYAKVEEEKFFKFHESDCWPKELSTTATNLLQSNLFDTEITSNKGNEFTVIPSLLKKYKNEFPSLYKKKLVKFNSLKLENPDDTDEQDT